jgi:hypothetical protein
LLSGRASLCEERICEDWKSLEAPAWEVAMSKDVSIVDMVVHLHPESSRDDRETIEAQLRALDGVVSVHFSEESHPHALIVAYNPDAVSSKTVLGEVRNVDSKAVMAGL